MERLELNQILNYRRCLLILRNSTLLNKYIKIHQFIQQHNSHIYVIMLKSPGKTSLSNYAYICKTI